MKVGLGAQVPKRRRRKRSRVSKVDGRGNWWTLPRPKTVSHSCPPNQQPALPAPSQPLPLILTTLQLSSQPRLPIVEQAELQEELDYWKDRAAHWDNKFQVAEAARLCVLKEVQRLQKQVKEWAELLDQGQVRENELQAELEKFQGSAPDPGFAQDEQSALVAEIQQLTSELFQCQQELRWEEERISSCELDLQRWRDWCCTMGLQVPFDLR